MSSARSRFLLSAAAAAACLIALTACGGKATPNANPTGSGGPNGVLGTGTATASGDTTTPPPATGTTTTGNSQPPPNPYPSNAKDYGLAILAAIKANNHSRIVDLSNDSTAQYIDAQNYPSKNGSWSYVDCASGSPQQCHYFNQTGDSATIAVDSAKLGGKGAVNYVLVEGGTFPNDTTGYVGSFISEWINGSSVGQHARAVNSVVSFVNSRTVPMNTTFTATTACGSGKTCVASGTETAAGQPFGQITCYTVQNNLLGKPQAIVGAKDGYCS